MQQVPNYSIHISQSKYIRAIQPIHIKPERRKQLESPVTEDERQDLRALIGSLQYGAVHTRPDLASRLTPNRPSTKPQLKHLSPPISLSMKPKDTMK